MKENNSWHTGMDTKMFIVVLRETEGKLTIELYQFPPEIDFA